MRHEGSGSGHEWAAGLSNRILHTMSDDVKLSGLVQVTLGRMAHEHPVFSPDGKSIAYYGGTYGQLQIYLVGDDGKNERPLTCAKGNHTQPDLSPDGKHVYFRWQPSNESPWSIVRVAVDDPSDRVVLLTDSKVSFKHPSVSPDGAWLAWFCDAGTPGNFHLFKARLSSKGLGKPVQLTDDRKRNDCHPTWSPDGKSLAFHAYMGVTDAAHSHIFVCSAEGRDARQLTTEPGYHKHPFFVGSGLIVHHVETPDGKRRLVLRSSADGEPVGHLTSGKYKDKHPSPYVPERGPTRICFSSKKRGFEIPGQEASYEVFWGVLEGARVAR